MTTSYQDNNEQVLEEQETFEELIRPKLAGLAHFYVILLSIMSSLLSILWPVLSDFSTIEQTQHLYTGLMMSKGVLPYNDIYATGGILYYAVIALAYFLGSPLWLLVVHFLAYYVSGRYLYKIIVNLTHSSELAVAMTALFYLFNAVLGFGGLYPIQWAYPFLLSMIWFLIAYRKDLIKDEHFIAFGLAHALAFLIEPRMLIFGVLAMVTLFGVNIRLKRFARGFYQALCFIFGSILVIYSAGYVIFNEQLSKTYFEQPIVYYLSVLQTRQENLLISVAYQIGILVGLGFFIAFRRHQSSKQKSVTMLLVSSTLIYSVYAIRSQSLDAYHLLFVLAQCLILASLTLIDDYSSQLSNLSHRRHRRVSLAKHFWGAYFTKAYLLPLFLIIGLIGQIGYRYVSTFQERHERREIASFIKHHTAKRSKIYVWDNQADIYLQSERASLSPFITPNVYMGDPSHAKRLEDTLLQGGAEWFILSNDAKINQAIKEKISEHYQKVSIGDLKYFVVYQLK